MLLAVVTTLSASEDASLASAFLKAEAALFADDMARLDAMFASHSCRHVYLDAGTNVGAQLRKVLEPARYPLSGAGHSERQFRSAARFTREVMQSHFGNHSPRCDVCAVGIEPNPMHAARLRHMESALTAAGFGVVVFHAAATDAYSVAAMSKTEEDTTHEHWAAHLVAAPADAKNRTHAVMVRTMDLARLIQELDLRLRRATVARGALVMKIDIEGSEFVALPQMIATGTLCAVDEIFLEWHSAYSKIPMGPGESHSEASAGWLADIKVDNRSAADLFRSTLLREAIGKALVRARHEPGCRTGLIHIEDDETYQHDRVALPAPGAC
tara:strand:+ start:410 stop:1390 length:981 start_codon:yes stop_codon:yes gene_type:complete